MLTPDDAGGADANAEKVFIEVQVSDLKNGGNGLDLDEGDLNDDGDDQNDEEELVAEEACEGVDFIGKELSCVNLIEDLKHHIGVEEEGIMSRF